jgi:putative redox protein
MDQVVIQWTGSGVAFDSELPGRHNLTIDEPEPLGTNLGASPTDMLLAALAACSGISAISLTRKMRQPVLGLEVAAIGERQEEWPKGFTKIHLRFQFEIEPSADHSRIEDAVERAVSRYCPVSATLQLGEGGCEVTHEVAMISQSRP